MPNSLYVKTHTLAYTHKCNKQTSALTNPFHWDCVLERKHTSYESPFFGSDEGDQVSNIISGTQSSHCGMLLHLPQPRQCIMSFTISCAGTHQFGTADPPLGY